MFHSVYVPYSNQYIVKDVSDSDAFKVQSEIIQKQQAVTWVIHDCKREREITQKVLNRK